MYSEDIQEELDKIQNLLESCFISKDEYNRRKSEITGTPINYNSSTGNSGNPPTSTYSYNNDYSNNSYNNYNNSNDYNNNNDSYNTSYFGNSTTNYNSFDNYKEEELVIPVIETLSINSNSNENNYNNYNNNNNNNNNNKNYNNNNYKKKYTYNNKKQELPKEKEEETKLGGFASMFLNDNNNQRKLEEEMAIKREIEAQIEMEKKLRELTEKNKPGPFASMFLNESSNVNNTNSKIDIVGGTNSKINFKQLDFNSKKMFIDFTNWTKDKTFLEPSVLSIENWKGDKIKQQNQLKTKIIYENIKNLSIKQINCNVKLIGGCDISFPKNNKIDAVASIVVLEYPSLKVVFESYKMIKLTEPYVAGYLAFREVPHFLELWTNIISKYPQFKPDLMILDGNGINHQRSVGAATHFGILANIPTIGVAKNLLVAKGITPEYIDQGFKNGNVVEMIDNQDNNRTIGHAMHNKQGEIIYISPGHMIDANTALEIVSKSLSINNGRINRPIPEPTYQADHLSRLFIKNYYNEL